jgi:hypothetical protein
MVIVAFLQNMWVRDAARLRSMIERHGEDYRREMCRRLLFAGCVTGTRLRAALGSFCDEIIWDECTRDIADNPRDILPPQREHIRTVIEFEKPSIVLAFGKVAASAVFEHGHDVVKFDFLTAMHPAARNGAMESFNALRFELEKRTGKVAEWT